MIRARWICVLALTSCVPNDDGAPTNVSFDANDPASTRLAEQFAREHITKSISEIASQVVLRDVKLDGFGHAIARYDQQIGGVPVFGAAAVAKIDASGKVLGMIDRLARDVRVDLQPQIDAKTAIATAIETSGASDLKVAMRADLQILLGHGKDALTHRVQLQYDDALGLPHREVIFVDAASGDVVWAYNNLQTAKNREMHNLNHSTTLPGPTVRTEGGPATGDSDIDTNYNDLGATYDCYNQLYGRDSYDNAGAKLISSVHYSTNYVNAFWNGTQMVYGDGDNVNSRSLAIAIDVTAHELTHAVTELTSNLIYAGESGGLNESFSDIFGNTCEWFRDNNGNPNGPSSPDNYLVGEEVWLADIALRFMADPALDGASLDFWTSQAGNVDVHFSSGIQNLWWNLLSEGGTHPRGKSNTVVTGIGIRDASAIAYRTNTHYLVPASNYGDARVASIQSAVDLFGAGSQQATQVANAWTAVGVLPPPPYVVIDTKPNLSSTGDLNFSYATNGATAMKFVISGGTGDADIYVRFGAAPTGTLWDCRPFSSGNNETCEFNPAQQGTYFVMIRAFAPYTGVTLTVSAANQGNPGTETSCNDGVDNDGDGATDCADSDCAGNPVCNPTTETSCSDGVDNDGDGATDCADSDCAADPVCQPDFEVISSTNFESGLGPFQNGGDDAVRVRTNNANSPRFAVRLRDNSGAGSSIFSRVGMNLAGKTELRIEYSMIAQGMEAGEDYLVELSVNNGAYQTVASFAAGTGFQNNVRQQKDIQVPLPGTDNVKVRLRCDASQDNDQVFIDDVVISAR